MGSEFGVLNQPIVHARSLPQRQQQQQRHMADVVKVIIS